MSHPVIQAHRVCKRYQIGHVAETTLRTQAAATLQQFFQRTPTRSPHINTIWALQDVSFDVEQGEVLGVIGRNGSGKSTLLKILARITRPTSGWIGVKGQIGSLLEVGTGFSPELTGRENVYLSGAVLGLPKREIASRFDEIVEFSEIAQFLDTPVKHYSSGMYLRLAFAVASHLTADILLIDEILGVGDAAFRQKSATRMQELVKAEGRTIILVSHDSAAIASLCTKCLYLQQGALVAVGEPTAVLSQYLQETTTQNGWS
jgi:lipopolysaccharide transport system ATP-binding protein